MRVLQERSKIVVEDEEDFDIKQILECGQVFSFCQNAGEYVVVSMDRVAHISICGNKTIISTPFVKYFYNYFDLGTNYGEIKEKIRKCYPNFDKFFAGGKDIRILHQDPFQTIISFIVSANNNIPRIKKILNNICKVFGRKIEENVYSFPTLQQLKCAKKEDFDLAGAGYRSEYLVKTIELLQSERFSIENLKKLPTNLLRKTLMALAGVGGKVADCILFFGFGRGDSFPVDTWIRKAYSLFCSQPRSDKEISKYFLQIFGDVAGYAQQYIFNFMINCKQAA